MEITIGEYGRMMFEIMTSSSQGLKHWNKIREKARPLIFKLIKLNQEMHDVYTIVGYVDEAGNKKLSNQSRIIKVQKKLWGITASELNVGDLVYNRGLLFNPREQKPALVEFKKKNYLAISYPEEEYIEKINKHEEVLKIPNDWDKEVYKSDEYWLKLADKLEI